MNVLKYFNIIQQFINRFIYHPIKGLYRYKNRLFNIGFFENR